MTVGFHSPLPPARTGVADYAAALLTELRRRGPVETGRARASVDLYHLGNNRLHAAIYRRALERPGVIVLHDALLHHFLLGHLTRPDYENEFVYNYGEWFRSLASELWLARSISAADPRYFAYPMLRRIAERSRAVIVHNPAARETVLRHAPQAHVVEIPHLFAPPALPTESEAIRFRASLGLLNAFVIGVFGFLRESKRLSTVLEVFESLRAEFPAARLLIAGAFASTDLERATAPLLASPGIVRLPYLNERDFWLAASSVDACVNLRYPAAGETSGIAIRLMGLGKPVLLTEGPEYARFPEDACLRVEPGTAERDSLRALLVLLLSVPEAARTAGQRGSEHIRACHGVEQIGDRYWQLLTEFAG